MLDILENEKEYGLESAAILQSLKNQRGNLESHQSGNFLFNILDLYQCPFTDSELCSIAEVGFVFHHWRAELLVKPKWIPLMIDWLTRI